jgi:hypothetical protein
VDTAAEWPHVSLEEIVRLQPEVLVFASAHAGDTQHDIDALRTRPGWKDLAAMQDGNIVVVSDAINRPAPRMVDAIEQLARALHPEAFASASGAGFSLWNLFLGTRIPHRLKLCHPSLIPIRSFPLQRTRGLRMRPLTVRRLLWTCGGLAVLLLASVVLALKLGAVPISVTDLIVDLGRIAIGRANELPTEYRMIVFDLRLPRILLGIMVGAALSVSGASFQALLRNPLADPYVLGVSSGAALGSILALIIAPAVRADHAAGRFLGAGATIARFIFWAAARDSWTARRCCSAASFPRRFFPRSSCF